MSAAIRFLLLACFAAACASGGSGSPGDDQPKLDASTREDAPAPIDAPMTPVDGPASAVDAMPDAPPSLFCTANNQCTVPGECCVTLGGPQGFCAPGTIVLGTCVPN